MFYPRCYLRTLPVLCRSRDCGAQASPNSSLVKMCEEGKRRQQELLHRSLADLEGVRHSPRSESRSRRIQPDVCDYERAHVHAPVATRSLLLEINLSKAISAHRGDSGCSTRAYPFPALNMRHPPTTIQVLVLPSVWCCCGMASFTYQQGLGEVLRRYAPDIDEGLVSVLGAIGLSSGAIGEHLK